MTSGEEVLRAEPFRIGAYYSDEVLIKAHKSKDPKSYLLSISDPSLTPLWKDKGIGDQDIRTWINTVVPNAKLRGEGIKQKVRVRNKPPKATTKEVKIKGKSVTRRKWTNQQVVFVRSNNDLSNQDLSEKYEQQFGHKRSERSLAYMKRKEFRERSKVTNDQKQFISKNQNKPYREVYKELRGEISYGAGYYHYRKSKRGN